MSTASLLSKDPSRALEDLVAILRRLMDTFARETDALKKADTKTFMTLQEEKLRIARQYQKGMEEMLARKDEIGHASLAFRGRLEMLQKDFTDMCKANLEALGRMHRTTERLGATIKSAALDTARRQRVVNYGETGALTRQDRKAVSTGVSETA